LSERRLNKDGEHQANKKPRKTPGPSHECTIRPDAKHHADHLSVTVLPVWDMLGGESPISLNWAGQRSRPLTVGSLGITGRASTTGDSYEARFARSGAALVLDGAGPATVDRSLLFRRRVGRVPSKSPSSPLAIVQAAARSIKAILLVFLDYPFKDLHRLRD
jgi:hypothetical protein